MYARCLSDPAGRGKLVAYINKRADRMLNLMVAETDRVVAQRQDTAVLPPDKRVARLAQLQRELVEAALYKPTSMTEGDKENEAEELMLYVVILAQQNQEIAVPVLRPIYRLMQLDSPPLRGKCRAGIESLKDASPAFENAMRVVAAEVDPLGARPWFIRCGFECLPICNSMRDAFRMETGTEVGADKILKSYLAQRQLLLFHAAAWNDCDLVDRLMRGELGANYNRDVNRRSAEFGSATPLSVAAINGHLSMVALLLHHSFAKPISALEFIRAIRQGKAALSTPVEIARITKLMQASLECYGLVEDVVGTPDLEGLEATLVAATRVAEAGSAAERDLLAFVLPLVPDKVADAAHMERMLDSFRRAVAVGEVRLDTTTSAAEEGDMDLLGVAKDVTMVCASWEEDERVVGIDAFEASEASTDACTDEDEQTRRYEWRFLPRVSAGHGGGGGDGYGGVPGGDKKADDDSTTTSLINATTRHDDDGGSAEPQALWNQPIVGWLTGHWIMTGMRHDTNPAQDCVFYQRGLEAAAPPFMDTTVLDDGASGAEDDEDKKARLAESTLAVRDDGIASV